MNTKLWQPIQVVNIKLKHRLAMAPMTRSRATAQGLPTDLNAGTGLSALRPGDVEKAPSKAQRITSCLTVRSTSFGPSGGQVTVKDVLLCSVPFGVILLCHHNG
jgi:hypothetical protein